MLKFFSSLSFLYAFAILVLIFYGVIYYRDFARSMLYRRKFPVVFGLIALACFAFLWINIHAPMKLDTFSNIDHHFVRHDGFQVRKNIVLGRSDTANYTGNAFNRFVLEKKNGHITVSSPYSEEPFYAGKDGIYKIASTAFPAGSHRIAWQCDSLRVGIALDGDSSFVLSVNKSTFKTGKQVRKGLPLYTIFRDNDGFINSPYYTHEKLVSSLKHILVLRDDVSKKDAGELKYFLSGRFFQFAGQLKHDDRNLKAADLGFSVALEEGTAIAWGIGFLDNNRNQFRVKNGEGEDFYVINRFPVSYPLTAEHKENEQASNINKFLVAGPEDMLGLPPVFREGFLFPSFNGDTTAAFSPVLLSYHKAAGNEPLDMKVRWLDRNAGTPALQNDSLIIPAKAGNFSWLFSIRNTYKWELGSRTLSPATWQLLMFGALLFFVVLIIASSLIQAPHKISWVWQLLSCIALVMLTTRFFLYWRYKSFPPFEGMDIASIQQLNSFWNFGVIIAACVLLGLVFGFSNIRMTAWKNRMTTSVGLTGIADRIRKGVPDGYTIKPKLLFFGSWLLALTIAGAIAALSNFESATCRHLSIALVLLYFIYVFISYKYSPLVKDAGTSWWDLDTNKFSSLVVSNPVKVLLSVSLLAVFAFVDIGFSIVFLNFLLFNEAFLCINYAIAGLSAGSKRNAGWFGTMGAIYLVLFIVNLLYAPYIFDFLLGLSQQLYLTGYFIFSLAIAWNLLRVFRKATTRIAALSGLAVLTAGLFAAAWFFFPRERVLSKASMTRYRIDVQIMPSDQAITKAYEDGKTYEPVIRAAQNQWFINTFIHEDNNPGVQSPVFRMLPHAPQNKGAKYNAQATDLVASRFFIAEHGKWSVLLYILLLLLPATMLASFYKLYPDFTSRVNNNYPAVTAGFSVLNYLLISALLVILAATGKYIFFGQDLPFGSILSKQSILVPSLFIVISVFLFSRIPQEYYANRRKIIPGAFVFAGLLMMLLFVKPVFNRSKEFAVAGLAREMDLFIETRLQPIWDHFDTSKSTRRLGIAKKDKLFADSLRSLLSKGWMQNENKFFIHEAMAYTRSGFSQHLDAARMLYLDISSGSPQLAVNPNYFRVEAPPHLQQSWTGNVFSDTSVYNIALWDAASGSLQRQRVNLFDDVQNITLKKGLVLSSRYAADSSAQLYLYNRSAASFDISYNGEKRMFGANDSLALNNPYHIVLRDTASAEMILTAEPDAFMKNYYVNGNRYYTYPLGNRFTWARNFAESISSDHITDSLSSRDVFVSFDFEMMDSLSQKIGNMFASDTAYKSGAEYAICIADGNGRIVSMVDFIKDMGRPDPNNKAEFNSAIRGENGFVSQAVLRKQIGNINLLRLNPGPGSTLKPVVFSAIASQMDIDWNAFAAEGFSQKQSYYGGERVAEYDFEKNNGRITKVTDYLKYSDNYYYSNLLLLGSYPKQHFTELLSKAFVKQTSSGGFHWPYFSYGGTTYYLDQFENWPGYQNGKASFGSENSFVSLGLWNNFNIYTRTASGSFDRFATSYDSLLFLDGWKKSGFILPEYALFDQQASEVDHRIPYDLFTTAFRGHVKGSSQVMMAPVKMLDAYGKMISQSRNYSLTLNPYAKTAVYVPFDVDENIGYNNYLTLMRESVFQGMKEALFNGTAARLGSMLKNGTPYYYYAKTGTTGDNELKTKSKLLAVVITSKDIANPDFSFRNNKFYTIYFTSQNGPAKQNEEFQATVIKYIQESPAFRRYMK